MTQRAWTEAHVAAFEFFGGVPAKLTPDNLKAGVCKPDLYHPKINRGYASWPRTTGACWTRRGPTIRGTRLSSRRTSGISVRLLRRAQLVVPGRDDRRRRGLVRAGRRAAAAAAAGGPHRARGVRRRGGRLAAAAAGAPFEAATWPGQVAPDAHVVVGRTLYSVPWRLIGKRLDVRATEAVVEFFLDGELVKTHVFAPRGRRTDWADLPEHKSGFFMRTPACRPPGRDGRSGLRHAGRGAAGGQRLVPAAAGPRGAAAALGDARLEAACARAIEAGDPSYRTVKGILAVGTERDGIQLPLPGVGVPAWLRGPDAFGGEQR